MYNDLIDSVGFIAKTDKELADAMADELKRQKRNLELIASENIVSPAVMAAMGSVLTNKYAEGYPGKRYYGGCEYVDVVETIAIERAKKLFGANFANVQPHSGAQANTAVYFALLQPGDTVLGMSLAHGGHLTHGSPVNISGKYYNFVPYGLNDETGMLDYDEVERLANENKPKLIVAGASAYPRKIDFEKLSAIAKSEANPQLNIAFTVKDPTAVKEKLLASAADNARKKAEILCAASGVKLGELINIDYNWGEINVFSNTNFMRAKAEYAGAGMAFDCDITPQDITSSDTVNFTWEII